jgi:hypothetical protein
LTPQALRPTCSRSARSSTQAIRGSGRPGGQAHGGKRCRRLHNLAAYRVHSSDPRLRPARRSSARRKTLPSVAQPGCVPRPLRRRRFRRHPLGAPAGRQPDPRGRPARARKPVDPERRGRVGQTWRSRSLHDRGVRHRHFHRQAHIDHAVGLCLARARCDPGALRRRRLARRHRALRLPEGRRDAERPLVISEDPIPDLAMSEADVIREVLRLAAVGQNPAGSLPPG